MVVFVAKLLWQRHRYRPADLVDRPAYSATALFFIIAIAAIVTAATATDAPQRMVLTMLVTALAEAQMVAERISDIHCETP